MKRDRGRRDFRRIDGRLHLYAQDDKVKADPRKAKRFAKSNELDRALVHGPYLQGWREDYLRKLLAAQMQIREQSAEMSNFEVITLPELEQIRRIWVVDKHEIEDSLPRIYREVTGNTYPGVPLDDQCPLDHEALGLLQNVCERLGGPEEDWNIRYGMVREMLSQESRFRTQRRRAGLFEALEKALQRHHYWNERDAVVWARTRLKSEEASEVDQQLIEVLGSVLAISVQGEDDSGEPGLPGAFK